MTLLLEFFTLYKSAMNEHQGTSRQARFYYLDLLRLVASVGVVVFHVASSSINWTRNLYLMVDFFFILSGFVLMPVFPRDSNIIGLRKFIEKRIWRLIPITWVTLIFVLVYSILINLRHLFTSEHSAQTMPMSIASFISAMLLLQVFSSAATLLNYPLWSLSAEFLVNIYQAIQIHKLKSNNIIFFVMCLNLVIGLLIQVFTTSESGDQISRAVIGISFGIMLRILFEKKTKNSLVRAKLTASVSAIIYMLFFADLNILQIRTIATVVFGIIIFQTAAFERKFGFNLNIKTAQTCGSLSFGIYVWHAPLSGFSVRILQVIQVDAVFTEVLLLLGLATFVAYVSIYFIENPLNMFLKARNGI